jgi:transposase
VDLIEVYRQENEALRAENVALRAENVALRAENAALRAENALLKEQIRLLEARLSELEARLNQNSKNSHRPPSTDGFKRPTVSSVLNARDKGKKPPGGQEGHPGSTLSFSEHPDKVVNLQPTVCAGCEADLTLQAQDSTEVMDKRQVFELPKSALEVTEFRRMKHTCTVCGKANVGSYPIEVAAPVQYGDRALAFAVFLSVEYSLPFAKISELFETFLGTRLNESTIQKAVRTCAEGFQSTKEEVKNTLENSPVVHFDETGLRTAGKLAWLHTATNEKACYYFVHPKRGLQALNDEKSILPNFKGVAVHDFWKSYGNFICEHVFCNAHTLREWLAIKENDPLNAELADKFIRLLVSGYKKEIPPDKVEEEYQKLLEIGLAQNPEQKRLTHKRGKTAQSKARNLLLRFQNYQKGILAFLRGFPFTNNLAERALRMIKTKLKVAGCFRTFEGAEYYACIKTMLETAKKLNINPFEALMNHRLVVDTLKMT